MVKHFASVQNVTLHYVADHQEQALLHSVQLEYLADVSIRSDPHTRCVSQHLAEVLAHKVLAVLAVLGERLVYRGLLRLVDKLREQRQYIFWL